MEKHEEGRKILRGKEDKKGGEGGGKVGRRREKKGKI